MIHLSHVAYQKIWHMKRFGLSIGQASNGLAYEKNGLSKDLAFRKIRFNKKGSLLKI
jgi:hypothetical protein